MYIETIPFDIRQQEEARLQRENISAYEKYEYYARACELDDITPIPRADWEREKGNPNKNNI